MVRAPTAVTLGVALIVAGAAFDTPSLLVAGAGLVLLAVGLAAWVELARPRRLERAGGPSRIVEGDRYPLRITARGGLVGAPGGELRDSLLDAPVALGPGWRRRHSAEVVVEGRGRRALGPATLVVRDPLGLHSRRLESAVPSPLLVLPRIEPVLAAGRGAAGRRALAGLDEGAGNRSDPVAIELEVDGLRPYRPGTPASRIHWPAVARTGELHERQLVGGRAGAPLVVLDASQPHDPAALDSAVRAAASLCFHLARAGGCVALLPDARRPTSLGRELRGWPELHARFALVEEADGPPPAARALRRATIFWISAAELPTVPATTRGDSRALYVVSPGPPASGAPLVFTVAGCGGVRIAGAVEASDRNAA